MEQDKLIDEMPLLEKPGFCGLFKAMGIGIFQTYWENKALGIAILIFVLMLVNYTAIFGPAFAVSWNKLTYTDFSGVFDDSHNKHYLKYNLNYADGSPNQVANRILSTYD